MSDVVIEVLGSAGAVPTPRVGCPCEICAEALEKGPPYSRCGPSYFVHGPNVLIDTPEEIRR
jgi:phosphoribosyl 1,2-cyclic phosphate phosphodiesterase